MTEIIVGIDLGTTNSEVAIHRNGRVEVLADTEGCKILPSVVGLAESGELLVGEAARNQSLLWPERTVRSIKRRMGLDERVTLAGQAYTPSEISAMILRQLKHTAEQALGQPVRKAVITVPAYFSDAQRQATREAGEIAGLEVMRIINEPTAAALVYEAGQQQGKRILVYDLGGGTFDVSVVRIEEGVVEVLSSHGNNYLGGDDFDQKIVAHVLEHLKDSAGIDIADQPRAMARVLRAAEAAKRQLSDQPFTRIDEEYLSEVAGKPVHLALELAREDYEGMIAPLIEETLEAIHIALQGAGLAASEVEEILLVGGATRTPVIRRRLKEVFGLVPRGEVDPDLCVAMGAALQGAAIAGEEISAVLVDVTPYSFGTSVLGMLDGEYYPFCYAPIITKNTPIPVRRSEVFFTASDNQERVEVNVYQGEDPDARRNIRLGQFLVEGLSREPSGNPIIFDMSLDRDGILQVAAREKKTGLERRITIDRALASQDAAGLAEARRRIGALFMDGGGAFGHEITEGEGDDGDIADDDRAERRDTGGPAAMDAQAAEYDALLARAEAKLDDAAEEDRDELIDLIETIRDARADGDAAALAAAGQQLKDILFYLET